MEKRAIRELSHVFVTMFLSSFATCTVVPAITDVTMFALCPGQDHCSLAIYLTGFQQAITGIGAALLMPLIGNLSDRYGRKALLTLPLTISIIPTVILACNRTTKFFYAYFVLRTLTAMVSDANTISLALAYVADIIPEGERTSAFGVLLGVSSAAFVCGTLTSRFLSMDAIFQVGALASMLAAVYMRIFLKESLPAREDILQPILKTGRVNVVEEDSLKQATLFFKRIPSIGDLICLLQSSKTFFQVAVVAFFSNLSEGGMQASLLYFLKAQFQFSKNQFADLLLIVAAAGMVSQLVFMPLLASFVAEEKLLTIGLFAAFANLLLNSIAWSFWVPYLAALFSVFVVFVPPSLRSIASKQAGPSEQGKAQGCFSSITSFANMISPLIVSPLTALFLSEDAPFHFPGFCIFCLAVATMIAFVQSLVIRPIRSSHTVNNSHAVTDLCIPVQPQ